jgi:sorbitol-specific phosphotransferase system component IIA
LRLEQRGNRLGNGLDARVREIGHYRLRILERFENTLLGEIILEVPFNTSQVAMRLRRGAQLIAECS